jgi:hypothetical protein
MGYLPPSSWRMVNDRIVLSFKWVLSLDIYSGHECQVMAMGQ